MSGATRIKTVSFDLWDTVFIDDSDEPKRKKQGLPSKKNERRDLVWRYLQPGGSVLREQVDCAYDTADAAFKKLWHDHHVTWTVNERLKVVLAGLNRTMSKDAFADLVKLHEEMELRIKPDLVAGVKETLKELKNTYKLIVVSDAIFTPGWALRRLLDNYEVLNFFDGFVFSDEFGRSKPAPEVFYKASEIAGCKPQEMVHVGDREHNDILGAKAAGVKAILATFAVDRGSDRTKADAVCSDFRKLPAIINSLNHGS